MTSRIWLAGVGLLVWLACPVAAQQAKIPAPSWDTRSDTWVGVDALGRTLPTATQVGRPKLNKTLGMFYFLTFDHTPDGPYDNTKILTAHPEALQDIHNPAWGPLNASHYWGEPLFGYYTSDDKYVLRKHAQMLADAGVDVVIFDNSNAVTYDKARDTLCQVWEQMRREGNKTPQIAFLCPFGNWDGGCTSTIRKLYGTLYETGRYRDLWFRWQGKPLILADPSFVDGPETLFKQPTELSAGQPLGQTFTATKPFTAVGGTFPTWSTVGSGVTLALRADGPGGRLLAQHRFSHVTDNASLMLDAGRTLPPGVYALEMSHPTGRVGWWGYPSDVYGGGHAFDSDGAAPGDRSLLVQYADESQPQTLSPDLHRTKSPADAAQSEKIRDFFTFRAPIAPYNLQSPPRGQWAWLQIAPQAPQRDAAGKIEQVTVGVAQNYNATVNRTAPMSVPGAFGRSYHDGSSDTRPNAVDWGFNFAEQWRNALRIDPPFVFVTGWNEWTAGFYQEWAGFKAPPAIFVDEFDQEDSRDIEPMRGGHGDDYYYQLVSAVRRYKGVRPLPAVMPAPINVNGPFSAWAHVTPEFRDDIGDTAHRDAPGVGKAGPYANTTGRNDIVAAKVSYDKANVYFYVRTHAKLTSHTDPNWMLLFLNTDGDYKTGWFGYDYVLNRRVGSRTASLEKNVGGQYRWAPVASVVYRMQGNQLMIAVPRRLLGIKSSPDTIDFKWADNCYAKGDWTDFTLNGDAAPNDRFNYRAKLTR